MGHLPLELCGGEGGDNGGFEIMLGVTYYAGSHSNQYDPQDVPLVSKIKSFEAV